MTAPLHVPGGPVRVLIADDEPLQRAGLRRLLAGEAGVALVGEAADGLEAVALARALAPDVLLLDVQMPGLDGFGVLAALGDALPPAVVFVTAYDAHAVRAFEVHAADYLLKPFDAARVREALRRARERLRAPAADAPADLAGLLAQLAERPRYTERFVVAAGGRLRVVAAEDVEWFEAADNYVRLHSAGATGPSAPLLRETLKSLEGRLDPARFARVHRSAIVHLACVRELRPLDSGDYALVLASGRVAPMSRTYRDDVLRRLANAPR